MSIKDHIENLKKDANYLSKLTEDEIYRLFDYMERENKRVEAEFIRVTKTQRPFSELILKQVLFTEIANN